MANKENFSLRIEAKQREELEQLAKEQDIKLSELIRNYISEGIKNDKKRGIKR